MNEPHENLDPDPFAHDASRRPSRLRRAIVRHARPGAQGTCVRSAGIGKRVLVLRQIRPCTHTNRDRLR